MPKITKDGKHVKFVPMYIKIPEHIKDWLSKRDNASKEVRDALTDKYPEIEGK